MNTSRNESFTDAYDGYDYNGSCEDYVSDYNGSCDTSHDTIAQPAPLYLLFTVGVLGLFTILISFSDNKNLNLSQKQLTNHLNS